MFRRNASANRANQKINQLTLHRSELTIMSPSNDNTA